MPKSALPLELQDVENHFPDDDAFNGVPVFGKLYRWYQKTTKTWFCFSYRCTGLAKWRKYPKILFGIKGKGPWRYENGDPESFGVVSASEVLINSTPINAYLSRVQYYTRWHFAIQWPLMVSFHFYFKASSVPIEGQPMPDTDNKLFYFYWNHFDADLVYWMLTSIYAGLTWK